MRHAMRAFLALSLFAALAAAGCKKDTQEKKDPAAKPTEGDKPSDKPSDKPADNPTADKPADKPADTPPGGDALPAGAPEIKLLSAGADPKKELRLKPKAGDKQSMVMAVKMNMEMSAAGMNQPAMTLPTMKMTMDMVVKDVAANGDITYEFVLSEVDAVDEGASMPQMVGVMKQALAGAKGMTGTGTVTDRGFNKGADFKMPPGADPMMSQMMGQMKDSISQLGAPLPAEPVGVGAKWEVHMKVTQQGMTLKQVATYELTKIDGNVIEAKTTITQHADPQKISNPQMPNVKMDLVSMESSGGGGLKMDMTRIAPMTASGDIASKAEMAMDMGGQKQSMKMNMKINMKVEGK